MTMSSVLMIQYKLLLNSLIHGDRATVESIMGKYYDQIDTWTIFSILKKFKFRQSAKYFYRVYINGYLKPHVIITTHYKDIVAINGILLKFVPLKSRTMKICKIAVKSNPYALQYVPHKSYKLYKLAVKQSGYVLKYVSKITPKLCKLAVSNIDSGLMYVPPCMRTTEICYLSVSACWPTLKYVPLPMKTENLCEFAIEKSIYAIQYIPPHMLKPEWCYKAVMACPSLLRYVPKPTFDICKLAVSLDSLALQFVPRKYKSILYWPAVSRNVNAFQFILKIHKTRELCWYVVSKNVCMFRYVPKKSKMPALCKLAIALDACAYKYLPPKIAKTMNHEIHMKYTTLPL